MLLMKIMNVLFPAILVLGSFGAARGWAATSNKDVTRPSASQKFISTEGYSETRWGMNRAAVRKLYPKMAPFLKDSTVTHGKVADKSAKTMFFFTKGKLDEVTIFFQETHSDIDGYRSEYESLKELLTKKYGQPTVDKKAPSTDGGDILSAQWETEKTHIGLVCSAGPVFKLTEIDYSSKELSEKKKEKSDAEKLRDL